MTIKDIIQNTTAKLKQAGIESASLDCRLLLCKFLNVDKIYLITNSEKEIDNIQDFEKLVQRRINHEPMQYILGQSEFMGLDFYVDENVLIPRPDTEIAVEKAIEFIGLQQADFLDIGTGSGCIPISILYNCKNATGCTVDISKNALDVAKKNAVTHDVKNRLTFINRDILEFFPDAKFHCIISNPPYIESDVIPTLMEDVKNYEPYIALDGGMDGLLFYRKISQKSFDVLTPGGLIIFEIGYNQGERVSDILKNHGFENIQITKDLSGNDRVVTAIKPL